jgi:hypothetical protein
LWQFRSDKENRAIAYMSVSAEAFNTWTRTFK